MEPRRYRVLVVRQDSPGIRPDNQQQASAGTFFLSLPENPNPTRRGTGLSLELPAYQNDVLTALIRTGGLPGLDAKNEIMILRRKAEKAWARRNTHHLVRVIRDPDNCSRIPPLFRCVCHQANRFLFDRKM